WRWCTATRADTPPWSSRCSAPMASRSRWSGGCRSARPPWAAPRWRCCVAPRCTAPRPTCSPTCAHPASCATRAWRTGSSRGSGWRAPGARPLRLGERPQPDRVLVATPERIRARRFHTVFVCGLQEGEFPRGRVPEPFLSDDDRRAIASATGLVLRVREDELDRERHLFYVAASRAERTLFLSSRFSDEEGNPQPGSFFLEDVR